MDIFKDKTLLITGGTGSFGNAVLNRFLENTLISLISVSKNLFNTALPKEPVPPVINNVLSLNCVIYIPP